MRVLGLEVGRGKLLVPIEPASGSEDEELQGVRRHTSRIAPSLLCARIWLDRLLRREAICEHRNRRYPNLPTGSPQMRGQLQTRGWPVIFAGLTGRGTGTGVSEMSDDTWLHNYVDSLREEIAECRGSLEQPPEEILDLQSIHNQIFNAALEAAGALRRIGDSTDEVTEVLRIAARAGVEVFSLPPMTPCFSRPMWRRMRMRIPSASCDYPSSRWRRWPRRRAWHDRLSDDVETVAGACWPHCERESMNRYAFLQLVFASIIGLGCVATRSIEAPSGSRTGSVADGHLNLVPMQLVVEDLGTIEMHANGRVEMEGLHLGTLHANGRFESAESHWVATLRSDGRVEIDLSPADDAKIWIDMQGSLTVGGETVLIVSETGEIQGGYLGSARVRLEAPPEGRSQAVFILLVAPLPATASGFELPR